MTDVLTAEQRHRCMSNIRGRDTGPEVVVRHLLHSMGLRYRLHLDTLPGKPDIVLRRFQTVVLVHGCFWHMHRCRYGNVVPATNAEFWQNKRLKNVERDRRVRRLLREDGWRVLVVWECQTRHLPELSTRLHRAFEPFRPL